jgi:hypothetical protein
VHQAGLIGADGGLDDESAACFFVDLVEAPSQVIEVAA